MWIQKSQASHWIAPWLELITYCSQSIFDANIRDKVNRSNFISILCDGSTDSGVVERNVNKHNCVHKNNDLNTLHCEANYLFKRFETRP